MRRLILWTLAWLLFGGALLAQATPQIKWEHDGANITTFKCVVDQNLPGEVTYDLGLLTPESAQTYSVNITACGPAGDGVMASGAHTLKIQACNGAVCTDSAQITVVKL